MRTETQIPPPPKSVAGAWRQKRKPRTTPRELGLARITIDVPEVQYKRLKIAAIEAGVTMRQLVLELLERGGITNK